jgi:hypothetical protein
MNNKLKLVLNGFLELSVEDKTELHELIKDYDKYPATTEKNINESLTEIAYESRSKSLVNFGPSPTGCPCCGN